MQTINGEERETHRTHSVERKRERERERTLGLRKWRENVGEFGGKIDSNMSGIY